MICAVSLLSLSGCLSKPEIVCDCSATEKELRAYTLKYFDALEDTGNLRQQLKACQGKR
jgi:hypothetical protein